MGLNFNGRKIERACVTLSCIQIVVLVFIGMIGMADEAFHWDLLNRRQENLAILIIAGILMSLGAMILIILLVNISLISSYLEKISKSDQVDSLDE